MTDLLQYARDARPLDAVPVIDIHGHGGTLTGCATLTLEEQIALMDRVGIDAVIMSACLALKGAIAAGNDTICDAMDRYPGRIFGYIHLSANYPECIEAEVARCRAHPGFIGIKLYQNGIPFTDPRFAPVWACAREHWLPVMAHTWGGNLTGFDVAAAGNPEVSFIAAHAGSDLSYQAYIDAAKRVPNFYLDLTYSREHPNMIAHFVHQLGAERIVWGTDSPLFSMAQQLCKVLYTPILDEDKALILGGNALRLYGERLSGRLMAAVER